MTPLQPGDPIWYHQVVRGGYGFGVDVPATLVRVTPRRVRIRVTLKDGSTREITVAPENVTPRVVDDSPNRKDAP